MKAGFGEFGGEVLTTVTCLSLKLNNEQIEELLRICWEVDLEIVLMSWEAAR